MILIISCSGFLYAVPPLESVSTEDARSRLIAAAEKYRGTPYRYGGMDRRGLDCSGLVHLSFRDALGTAVPRTTEALYRWVEKIPDEGLQRGDLVFFGASGGVFHVGIYAGEGRFIHAASSGPKKGVIYSRLDETYWRRTYAGAGRALPPGEAGPEFAWTKGAGDKADKIVDDRSLKSNNREDRLVAGIGLAPTWAAFVEAPSPIRGAAAQLRLAYKFRFFGSFILAGLEFRPEWDGSLGFLRLPLAFSLDFDRVIRIFGGPALGIGNPVMRTAAGDRFYTGGSSWFGVAGIQAAPLNIDLPRGTLSPYGEICWQSLIPKAGQDKDFDADLGAALRLSTGLRYTWNIGK